MAEAPISFDPGHDPAHEPCTVVVLAAGRGSRFGGDRPKQYLTLNGLPLIIHTLRRLHSHPLVARIVPVVAPDGSAWWQELAPFTHALAKLAPPVPGGSERQYSVANALAAIPLTDDGWVAIHDGARPLVDHGVLDRLFAARRQGEALLAAVPPHDTVKEAAPDGTLTATLDRSRLWLAQTPQLFRCGVIRRAHAAARDAGFLGTDDTTLVERLGIPVKAVMGDYRNIKVTRPEDLVLARCYLQEEKTR